MTEGVEPPEERLGRLLAVLLLVGAGIRLLAAIVAGFVEWGHTAAPYIEGGGRARAIDVLTTFGEGGDGGGLVLAVIATVLVWWVSRARGPGVATLQLSACWVLGVTAVLAVLQAVGVGLIYSLSPNDQVSRIILAAGFALAAIVIAVGASVLTRQFGTAIDDQMAANDIDAFVFALDRHTIDVRAFYSVREAVRRMHIYSVEEGEFDFCTDDGTVLRASIVDDRIQLRPTDEQHPDELVARLKEFALRRGITIDEDEADDPTAYVEPISRWQWLEMWPPWLRPFGYLFRRR